MRNESDPLLSDFEAHLQTLAPTSSVEARDRLLFEAGRRLHRRRLAAWQGGTVMLLAFLVAHLYFTASQPQRWERVQFIERPTPDSHVVQARDALPATASENSYLAYRIRVLDPDSEAAAHRGKEAKAGGPGVPVEKPVSYRALRQSL